MKYSRSLVLLPLAFAGIAVAASSAEYADNANLAINALQTWYNFDTGLWQEKWWQSGNMVTAIAKFGTFDESYKPTAIQIVSNSFEKSRDWGGYKEWINDYYDDEGWWALAWIASQDLTGDIKYLNKAIDIFNDMTSGTPTNCGGGIWWRKEKDSIAAISNELFLSVAAHIANRVGDNVKQDYVNWAVKEWEWFEGTGIINEKNIINDGIDPVTCKNNGKWTFTYNQGVILGGLAELAKATGDGKYTEAASKIAKAAMVELSENGILTEPSGEDGGHIDDQAAQFKGAFVRGLAALQLQAPDPAFKDFLQKNADTAWENSFKDDFIGDRWQGNGDVDAASQASGIDLLVGAAQVS